MADTAPSPTLSPDESLALTIANAIKSANLVSDQHISRIQTGLAKGNITARDWALIAELALTAATQEDAS